jgi:ATP-binding cassette subfamily B protein
MTNSDLQVREQFSAWKSEDSPLTLPSLEKLLNLAKVDQTFVPTLTSALEVKEYALGEEIFSFTTPIITPSISDWPENFVQSEQNSDYLYIICQGRVRVLGYDPVQRRSVSVLVLEQGDICGTDDFFLPEHYPLLPYRVVASGEGIVARISVSKLQSALQQHPALQAYLLDQSLQRQRLMFFKTLSDLRRCSSYQLRECLAEVIEHQIEAGTKLTTATPSDTGRFWLSQGEIRAKNQPPQRGDSWGYPDNIPKGWVAQTPLKVYQLPPETWEMLSGQIKSPAPVKHANVIPRRGVAPSQQQTRKPNATQASSSTPSKKAETPITFAKPTSGRRLKGIWRRYPFIEQQSSSDCGAACLGMISQYWGKFFSINHLRNIASVGRAGSSLKSLSKAAEDLGYQARPIRASFSRIENHKHPWVAHWQGNHYIVVYRIRGKKVLVADPALGKREISRKEFIEGWTGYALLLDPTDRLYTTPDDKRSLGRFIPILWPYRFLGLQIIIVSILIQLFGLVSPLFTQIILDQIVVSRNQTTLNVFVIGALLFGIWAMILGSVRKYLLSYLSNRLDLTMISAFINHAVNLPLNFFESRRVGDIITRVQENQKIQRFLISKVMLSWLNFVTGFIYLGLMLYYNARLTVLVLGLIPPIIIMTLAATPLLRKLSRERFSAAADQNSSLVEMMSGIGTLKASAAEPELRWRWEDLLTHQMNVRFKGQKLAINLGILNGLVNSIGGTALMWYGASLVLNNELSIGQYVAFNMMKGHIISPVIALAGLWDELQEVLISVERLNDVFETETEESPDQPLLIMPRIQGHVKLENMTFRYGEDDEANTLQNVTFEVEAGETVAIVGRSGSGKSTLIKLLQGLYRPNSGHIWIDGHDISHVSPPSLRSQMGVVPQECYLFSGTIAENVMLYRDGYSLEEVVEVAKLAEAHAFIQSMPLGYNTKVGERGSSLSGGQRQRVSIARALLGSPPILVLDEATSSLDTESERRFQRNLEQVSRDRTTFIIAHRLSTVRNANRIIVLDRGILVEQGNHEELMALEGLYYHLAQQQLDL